MTPPLHQAIADQLHQEARCWPWRRQLLADRSRELEELEHTAEHALLCYVGHDAIRAGVLRLRELTGKAGEIWARDELDCAEDACHSAERALIELRRTAHELEPRCET